MAVLKVSDLTKSYTDSPVLAVKALEIQKGKITCLVGPTGCGKTTLLNILAGLDSQFGGNVELDANTEGVSVMPQTESLLPWKTVYENIVIRSLVSGTTFSKERVSKLLAMAGMQESQDLFPDELSVGMRQRIALCRAFMDQADLVLLDEPTSSQDYEGQMMLERLMRSESKGRAIVAVTHNPVEAVGIADRIIVLGGKPSEIVDDFDVSFPLETKARQAIRGDASFLGYVSRLLTSLKNAYVQ